MKAIIKWLRKTISKNTRLRFQIRCIFLIFLCLLAILSVGLIVPLANSSNSENQSLGSENHDSNASKQDVAVSVLEKSNMIRSDYQTQGPAPRGEISIKPNSEQIPLGESFKITVEITNRDRGEPAGHPTLISLSFPQLDRPGDASQLKITDHSFPNGNEIIITKGEARMSHKGLPMNKTPAIEYAVIEVQMGNGSKWESGKTHFIEVEVTPPSRSMAGRDISGEFKVNARAALFGYESGRKVSWPRDPALEDQPRGHRDQQLHSVKHEYIEIIPPSECNILGYEVPVFRRTLCGIFTDHDIAAAVTITWALFGAVYSLFDFIIVVASANWMEAFQRGRE